jgi:hypothetical protein
VCIAAFCVLPVIVLITYLLIHYVVRKRDTHFSIDIISWETGAKRSPVRPTEADPQNISVYNTA